MKKIGVEMDIIGIIGEFDPFHAGHAYLLNRVRDAWPDSGIVCAMSGYFTQRGGAAIASQYARAEMALRCGADLVVELPVQWATASAERFAQGGVALLRALGAARLVFGSEAGEIRALRRAAEALDDPGFSQTLRSFGKAGLPFAAARQRALEQRIGTAAAVLTQPNNLLAIEYLRAIQRLAPEMEAYTVPRVGAAHHSIGAVDGFQSASALRSLLLAGRLEDACAGIPNPAAAVLRREWEAGRCPAALENNVRGIFTRLRTMSAAEFAALPDCGEGLEHRMVRAVRESVTLQECYARVKSKRYAHARVRRLILSAYLGLTAADRPEQIPYVRVLGLAEGGRMILRRAREVNQRPILGKPADLKKMAPICQRQFALEVRTRDLWQLCLPELTRSAAGGSRRPFVWWDGPTARN